MEQRKEQDRMMSENKTPVGDGSAEVIEATPLVKTSGARLTMIHPFGRDSRNQSITCT